MKKQWILAFSAFALISCGGGNGSVPEGSTTEESGSGEYLPYNQEQVRNKLMDLGETQGFEISYHAFDEEDEEVYDYTFGMKGNLMWSYDEDDKAAIKFVDGVLSLYDYDAETESFELSYSLEDAQEYYDAMVTSYTTMFFFANTYDGVEGYHKVRDLTFAGRAATEYRFDYTYAGAGEVHLNTIIDKEIGITLYWNANGKSYQDGEEGSATFEVTAFLTGNQVNVPVVE